MSASGINLINMNEEIKTFSLRNIIFLVVALVAIFGIIALAGRSSTPTNSPTNAGAINSPIMMVAQLTGTSEVPPVTTSAAGSGTFTVNTQNNTLAFSINFSGLSAAETGAHIHGPADIGTNAGILFPLPAGNPKTGTINYLEAQEADILGGRTYVNIHSSNFPAGEIRGWILPQ